MKRQAAAIALLIFIFTLWGLLIYSIRTHKENPRLPIRKEIAP